MVLLTALPMLWQISVKDCNFAGSLWLPPLIPPSPGHYPSFCSLLNLIALQPKPKWDHALLSFCPAYFESFGFETIRSYSAAHTAGTLCVDQIGLELDATTLLHPSKFWDYRHKHMNSQCLLFYTQFIPQFHHWPHFCLLRTRQRPFCVCTSFFPFSSLSFI